MPVSLIQANMARGVLTPLAHARVDSELYGAALADATNVIVSRYGGVTRAPGTLFNGVAKNADRKFRFIGFEFSREQVFAIEAGHLYLRFWAPSGQILSAGVPYEIATAYLEADLPYLKWRQSGDVLYIWCRGHQPRMLKRIADDNWTLTDYIPQDGPYLPINETATLLTPAARGSAVPIMTSNSAPTGVVSGSVGVDAYRVFDGIVAEVQVGFSGDIVYTFPGSTTRVVDAYWVRAEPSASQSIRTPSNWEFQGYDGANWVTLDTRNGEAGWGGSEIRYYQMQNSVAYRAYRFIWTATGDNVGGFGSLGELGFHEKATTQTPFNLVASSTVGINDGVGFTVDDLYRPIRLYGSDGRWRWAQIVGYASPTTVTIQLYEHALPNLSPIALWRIGAWSDITGWPAAGAIFEDRLAHARTDSDPLGFWASRSGDYDSFTVSTPIVDDDAVSARLTGGRLDDISWLAENGGNLIAGSASNLRTIGAADAGKPFSPTNIKQRAETAVPSSLAEPLEIEEVALFIDVFQQRLYETGFSFQSDGYLAREVSVANEHLFSIGVSRIVYFSTPHKVVFAVRTDGKVIAFTYDREQKVAGGTLVDWGGVVEDALVLPGVAGSDLWLAVRRTIDGETVRYIERMAPFPNAASQEPPVMATCALVYEGAATSSLTGYDAMAGETVGVWADGRDIGDAVVEPDGSLALPSGVGATSVVVGKRMPWRVETLRLAQFGNQDGSGMGRKVKVINAILDLFESAGVRAGSAAATDPVQHHDDINVEPHTPTPLRTGAHDLPVEDGWQNCGVFVIEGNSMHPATVRAISLEVEGEP